VIIFLYSFVDSCLETPENVKSPVNYSELSWKEIALTQQKTIKDIRKKVKVLQQKIRRQSAKIENLKVSQAYVHSKIILIINFIEYLVMAIFLKVFHMTFSDVHISLLLK